MFPLSTCRISILYTFLMENDPEGYKLAIAMRQPPKKDDKECESVLKDEDKEGNTSELDPLFLHGPHPRLGQLQPVSGGPDEAVRLLPPAPGGAGGGKAGRKPCLRS